jgi:hypothetical protein
MHGKRCASINKYLREEDIKITLLTSVTYRDIDEEIRKDFNVNKDKLLPEMYYDEMDYREDSFEVSDYHSVKSFNIIKWGYKTKILLLFDKLKLNNLLFFPDMSFTWIRRAYRKGKEIIDHDKFDLIYVTMFPFTSFVVAYKLAKKYKIPLVIDYSDPYSCHPFNSVKNRLLRYRRERLEKKIFNYATLKISIGKEIAELISRCLNVKNDFKIINTGFFEEFVNKNIQKRDIFTISYLGNFYGILTPVFKNFAYCLDDFIYLNKIQSNELKFVYAGGVSRKVIKRIINQSELEDYFVDLGKISQERCYDETRKGHVSVYLSAKGSEYVLPTKVFDYMASNTHVLVIGEECATTELFDKVEQKYTIVENCIYKIDDAIKKLYNDFTINNLKYGCNEEKLSEYSRRNQIKKLAVILKGLK